MWTIWSTELLDYTVVGDITVRKTRWSYNARRSSIKRVTRLWRYAKNLVPETTDTVGTTKRDAERKVCKKACKAAIKQIAYILPLLDNQVQPQQSRFCYI